MGYTDRIRDGVTNNQRVEARTLCRVIIQQGDFNAVEHRLFRRRGFAKTGRDHPRTQNNTAKRVQFYLFKNLTIIHVSLCKNLRWKRGRCDEGD